jgi:phenylpropionate dioxygenase-like ring-hydroxylating dioxygenase large terminal subunit
MRSRMRPEHYLSEGVFAREQELLFRRLWVFFGFKTQLARHNDYLARSIAGVPVVVQNFSGELKAFENVCLHRQAQIQTGMSGRRPLVCRYHGWGYDAAGRPENIPFHDDIYRFGAEERAALCLRQFALKAVGNAVFVNLAADPLPMAHQFSAPFMDSLRSCSESWDSEIIFGRMPGRYNWKLAFENLRDGNHPRFVHPATLAKHVTFQAPVDEAALAATEAMASGAATQRERREQLRGFSFGVPDAPLGARPAYDWHASVERWPEGKDYYYNWLAYPNLHIASPDGGYSFTIEQHVPVAPGQSELLVWWVLAKKTDRYPASAAVLHSMMLGGRPVLEEDIRVMELVQSGLHANAPVGSQGAYEYLNRSVEQWYTDLMDGRFEF